jgi:signal transduction histidine kinase/putative methionine-R-sulfoxide reductase with GAF domain
MSWFHKLSFPVWGFCVLFAVTNGMVTHWWIDGSSDPGWIEGHEGQQVMVLRVRPDGAASGLKFGDTLLLFDGQPVESRFSVYRAFRGKPVGTPYSLKINRAGQDIDFHLNTQAFSLITRITTYVSIGLVPLLFLFFAFLLILFSQSDYRALLLGWAFAMTVPEVPFFSLATAPEWMAWTIILGRPLSYLAFPLYLRFCLIYPKQSELLDRWPKLNQRRYFYLPYFIFGFLFSLVLGVASYFQPDDIFALRNSPVGFLARFGTILFYLPAAFYVIHRSLSNVEEIARKKLRLIKWGFILGFVPFVTRAFALSMLGLLPNAAQSKFGVGLLDWSVFIVFLLLASFPIFLVVAIVRQQLVPLKEPAKRAARLTLMQVGFVALVAVSLVVAATVMLYLTNSDFREARLTHRLFILIVTIGVPYAIIKFAEWAQRSHVSVYIKSRSGFDTAGFDTVPTFRFALVALLQKVIARVNKKFLFTPFSDDTQRAIRNAVYPKEFSSLLARRTLEVFQAIEVAVFIAEPSRGCYELVAYSAAVGSYTPPPLILPIESRVIKKLQLGGKAITDPLIWLKKQKDLAQAPTPEHTAALQTLEAINSKILLPIKQDDQLPLVIAINRPTHFSFLERLAMKQLARMAAIENEFASWRKVIESYELKTVLENLLVAAVRTIRPAQKGTIYLWDDKAQKLIIYAQYRYMPKIVKAIELERGEGFAGKAFENNERMIVDDFQQDKRGANVGDLQIKEIKSAMLVPFQAWGRTIGILCLDNVERTYAFDHHKHLARVERFGAIVSLAVQNARVQTELRRFGAKLDRGDVTCDEILAAVLESVASFTEVKATNLLLVMDPRDFSPVNQQRPLLSIAKGFQDDVAFCESFTPLPDGMTARALESLRKVKHGAELPDPIIYGSPSHPPILNRTGLEYGVSASICFPFKVNEFVAGMVFFNYFSSHSFQDSEIEALRLFANETALGIANALKREELQYIDKVVWMALLVSSLQHDLNQSTNEIENDLLILRHVMARSPDKYYVERVVSRIQHNVLEIQSHQQSMQDAWTTDFMPLDLCALVRDIAIRGCQANPGLQLDVSDLEDKGEYRVRAARLQLYLVVRNLISNAVRAALKSYYPSPSLTIKKRIHERRIELTITNTGEPIPPDLKAHIFKEVILDGDLHGGHGTGLWLGRRIIRRHQGDIDLLSSDESGTTFLLWLPLIQEATETLTEAELAYERI